MNCKYCDDYTGICAKPECPMCGDCCPVPDVEGVCKFEERRTSMATEKRLIDANALLREVMEGHPYEGLSMAAQVCTMELLTYAPTVDAVEVVHCEHCVNHGNCLTEDLFRMERIEKPYCCVGKMDGDKNG